MSRLPAPGVMPDFAEEVAGRLDDAALLAGVRAAFRRLRPDEQDVVALCVWSDLDYAAAAQALGIPVGTVRSRLSRARRKLRDIAESRPASPAEPEWPSGQVRGEGLMRPQVTREGTR